MPFAGVGEKADLRRQLGDKGGGGGGGGGWWWWWWW